MKEKIFLLMLALLATANCTASIVRRFNDTFSMFSGDVISFQTTSVINGSQITHEVFPRPVITTNGEMELIHSFEEISSDKTKDPNPYIKCTDFISPDAGEIFALCRETIINYWIFDAQNINNEYKEFITSDMKELGYQGKSGKITCSKITGMFNYLFILCGREITEVQISKVEVTLFSISLAKEGEIKKFKIINSATYTFSVGSFSDFTVRKVERVESKEIQFILFQASYATVPLPLRTSDVLITSFTISDNSFKKVYSGPAWNGITDGISEGHFFNPGLFLGIDKRTKNLFTCVLERETKAKFECTSGKDILDFDNSKLFTFNTYYNPRGDKSHLFLAGSERVAQCRNFNIVKASLTDCFQIDLKFKSSMKSELSQPSLRFNKNFRRLSLVYNSEKNPGYVAALVIVDIVNYGVRLYNMEGTSTTRIMPLTSQYMVLLSEGSLNSFYRFRELSFAVGNVSPKSKEQHSVDIKVKVRSEEENQAFTEVSSKLQLFDNEFEPTTLFGLNPIFYYSGMKNYRSAGYSAHTLMANDGKLQVKYPVESGLQHQIYNAHLLKVDGFPSSDLIKNIILLGEKSPFMVVHYSTNVVMIFQANKEDSKKTFEFTELNFKMYKTLESFGSNLVKVKAFSENKFIYILVSYTENNKKLWKLLWVNPPNKDDKPLSVEIGEASGDAEARLIGRTIFVLMGHQNPNDASDGTIIVVPISIERINSDESKLVVGKRLETIPSDFGIVNFNPGEVRFPNSKEMSGYMLNQHPSEFSILHIDYSQIFDDFSPSIDASIKPKTFSFHSNDGTEGLETHFCVTSGNIVILENVKDSANTQLLYAVNLETPDSSFLNIPLGDPKHYSLEKIEIVRLICPASGEFFQLLVKDKASQESSIITYFAFDGTVVNKKMHSSIKIGNVGTIADTSDVLIDFKYRTVFTVVTDSGNKGLSASTKVVLNGPILKFNTESAKEGDYDIELTLSNEVGSATHTQKLSVVKFPDLSVKPKEVVSLPPTLPFKERDLDTYISVKGPLVGITLDDSRLEGVVEVGARLRPEKQIDIRKSSGLTNIVAVAEDNILMIDPETRILKVYVSWTTERFTFDLKEFGEYCSSFGIDPANRTLYLIFVCIKNGRENIFIHTIQKTEKTAIKIFEREVPFVTQDVQLKHDDSNIYLSINEKGGYRISIWRMDEKGHNLRRIQFLADMIGDNSVFPGLKNKMETLGDVVVFGALSVDNTHISMYVLDFLEGVISEFYRFGFNDKNNIRDFSFDKTKTNELRLITWGTSWRIKEILFNIDQVNKIIVKDGIVERYQYEPLLNEKSDLIQIMPLKDYIMIYGVFILPGKEDVYTTAILYKYGSPHVYAILDSPNPSAVPSIYMEKESVKIAYYTTRKGTEPIQIYSVNPLTISIKDEAKAKSLIKGPVSFKLYSPLNQTKVMFYLSKNSVEGSNLVIYVFGTIFAATFIVAIIAAYFMSEQNEKEQRHTTITKEVVEILRTEEDDDTDDQLILSTHFGSAVQQLSSDKEKRDEIAAMRTPLQEDGVGSDGSDEDDGELI